MSSSPAMINTHITTFPPLPSYNLPLPPSTSVQDLYARLSTLIPVHNASLRLSTTSGHPLPRISTSPLSSFLSADDSTNTSAFLSLRLSVPLCGGKGGFGSQLRAAGGRMSSRKKSQENSDSCRNLDGRRMRTVKEAKALAAYLEVKPEMEKAEKEKRLARWRKIVEDAERRGPDGVDEKKRFDDHVWLEMCEEERERTREAVARSLREGYTDRGIGEMEKRLREGEGSASASGSSGAGSDASDAEEGAETKKDGKKAVPRFAGWDEDDEFMSSDDDDDDDERMEDIKEEEEEEIEGKGKGKGKA